MIGSASPSQRSRSGKPLPNAIPKASCSSSNHAAADAEDRPTAGDVVEGRRHLRGQGRLAERVGADHQADPDPLGRRAQAASVSQPSNIGPSGARRSGRGDPTSTACRSRAGRRAGRLPAGSASPCTGSSTGRTDPDVGHMAALHGGAVGIRSARPAGGASARDATWTPRSQPGVLDHERTLTWRMRLPVPSIRPSGFGQVHAVGELQVHVALCGMIANRKSRIDAPRPIASSPSAGSNVSTAPGNAVEHGHAERPGDVGDGRRGRIEMPVERERVLRARHRTTRLTSLPPPATTIRSGRPAVEDRADPLAGQDRRLDLGRSRRRPPRRPCRAACR